MRWISLLVCLLTWSCSSDTGDAEKKEHALYNDILDRLAWQCYEMCNNPLGSNAWVASNQHADSIKKLMRTQADRRILYYQPKIGARKGGNLADWLTVDISSWDRFNSTFSGTPPKNLIQNVATSSSLKAEDLSVDYIDVVKLDTASAQRDSSMVVVGFSTPFYSDDGNRAVVYFESACGSKSGRGDLLMMRYKETKWIIEERRRVWIKNDN